MKTGVFAIDFDGTCVTAEFPRVGKNIGARHILRSLVENGSKLFLFTLRGHTSHDWNHAPLETDILEDAVSWFKSNNIPLWGVNVNPDQEADKWTDSSKQFADVIIDDYNVCAPMRVVKCTDGRELKVLDWREIAIWLHNQRYLTPLQVNEALFEIENDIRAL